MVKEIWMVEVFVETGNTGDWQITRYWSIDADRAERYKQNMERAGNKARLVAFVADRKKKFSPLKKGKKK